MDTPNWWRENKGAPTVDNTNMRDMYNGFTLKELAHLGAFPDNANSKSRLSNLESIHPIFAQENWEEDIPAQFTGKRKLIPLGNDHNSKPRDGNWTAHNLLVWKVLEPSLKLASKFVENAHIFPWYDALIHGIKKTGQPQLVNQKHFISFHYRSARDLNTPESERTMCEFIAKIAQSISFGISDGDVDPRTGEIYPEGKRCYSVNSPPWEDAEESSRIWLAYQAILPIMQDEIPQNIRLACQFDIALILLREFAHIVTYSVRQNLRQRPELMCEDDLEFHPGLSFEVATFGGHCTHLGDSQGLLILRCSILKGWSGIKESPERHLLVSPEVTAKDGGTTSQYRSIPFCYLEDLFQEEFWKYFVKKWGAETLRIYPVTQGRIVLRKGGQLQDWKLLGVPNEYPKWVAEARNIDSSGLASLTADDQTAFKIAHGRIRRADKFAEATIAKKEITAMRKRQDDSPKSILEKRLQIQKKILRMHKYRCRARAEEADRFLRSSDIDTVEYEEARKSLIEKNRNDRVEAMEWKDVALNEDVAKEYQKIFDRYEKIKAIVFPEYGQRHRAPGESTYSERSADEWEVLLNKAHRLFKRNEISEATKICEEITEDVDAPNRTVAEAYLLLASRNGPDRLWNAQQAVEMFELIRRNRSSEFDDHINGRLGVARWHLQKARKEIQTKRPETVTSTKSQPTDSKNTAQLASSRLKLKDGLKVQVPGQEPSVYPTDSAMTERVENVIPTQNKSTSLKIVQSERAKEMEAATETAENEEIEAPGMPRAYGWKPKPRPGIEDLAPKTRQEEAQMDLYDEAYAARQKGKLAQSEQIFLTLLEMKHLNAYTQGMCHVQLATMAHRTDQAEQARRARFMFVQLELARPESQRAVADRKSADRLVRAVARAEREKERLVSSGFMGGLWSLLGRKRKRADDEDAWNDGDSPVETRLDGGADDLVAPSEDGAPPKKVCFS